MIKKLIQHVIRLTQEIEIFEPNLNNDEQIQTPRGVHIAYLTTIRGGNQKGMVIWMTPKE